MAVTKTLTKAIPFEKNGKVEKWDLVLMVMVCLLGEGFSLYMVSVVLIYEVSSVSHGLINTFIS